jgi:hypothetical protein
MSDCLEGNEWGRHAWPWWVWRATLRESKESIGDGEAWPVTAFFSSPFHFMISHTCNLVSCLALSPLSLSLSLSRRYFVQNCSACSSLVLDPKPHLLNLPWLRFHPTYFQSFLFLLQVVCKWCSNFTTISLLYFFSLLEVDFGIFIKFHCVLLRILFCLYISSYGYHTQQYKHIRMNSNVQIADKCDLWVCDGMLIYVVTITIIDIIHRPLFYLKTRGLGVRILPPSSGETCWCCSWCLETEIGSLYWAQLW